MMDSAVFVDVAVVFLAHANAVFRRVGVGVAHAVCRFPSPSLCLYVSLFLFLFLSPSFFLSLSGINNGCSTGGGGRFGCWFGLCCVVLCCLPSVYIITSPSFFGVYFTVQWRVLYRTLQCTFYLLSSPLPSAI